MANADNLIEALKIEHGVISKELTRFRPCHPETRCYFCREWAQYIYKKHVASSQKAQDSQQQQPLLLKAGRYRLRFANNATNGDDQKENARGLFRAVKQKVDQDGTASTTTTTLTSNNNGKTQQQQQRQRQQQTLIEEIISACIAWIEAPSSLTTLTSFYEPVQFDPYDEALFEVEDPKEPARLLDPLVVKRQHVYLPSKEFNLLKNLTGDVLLSHKEAMCDHKRPEWKSPSDLDVDRNIFNEKLAIEVQKALVQLEQALTKSWQPLTEFMEQLRSVDKERVRVIGKDECQKDIDSFASKQDITAFTDYWTPLAANFKKKQRTPVDLATVDAAFNDYFQDLVRKAQQFLSEFALPRLLAACALVSNLCSLVMPAMSQAAKRMASLENRDDATHKKNCDAVTESFEKLQPIEDVQSAIESVAKETEARIKEYVAEIEALKKAYEEGKPSVTMRLDKIANNKAFKKQIKKAEGGYHSIRQHFRYQLTQTIFPEQLFSKFFLVCIEALMQEGELMEAITIEREIKRFTIEHEEMVEERQYLFEDFEDGVATGRRELAGILGRLFLKEGMRIQGENLAMQRQYTLLQSLSGNGKDAAAVAAAIVEQKAAEQQEMSGGGGKKRKGRGKNGTADNSADSKQEGQLASERFEMLNKLCGAVLDEKTAGSASTTTATTSNHSSKSSSAVSSPAPKKATIHQQQQQQQQSNSTTKPKTTSPTASTPVSKPASPMPASKPVAISSSSKPTTPTPAAAAVTATTPSLQKSRTPSPPKSKADGSRPEPKKAATPPPPTVTAAVTPAAKASSTAAPPLQQQPKPKPASPTKANAPTPKPAPAPAPATGPAPVVPSPELGSWGAVNAADMVKGWNASKNPVSDSDTKSAQSTVSKSKQRQIVDDVKKQPVLDENDSGWSESPAHKGNTEADAWSTENTAIWTRTKDKREPSAASTTTTSNIPTVPEQSKKPTSIPSTSSAPTVSTTNDGWNEVVSKKKPQQQQQPVAAPASPATDGWDASNSQNTKVASGWGIQESTNEPTAAASDGWDSQEAKKAATANDGWGPQQEATKGGWGAEPKQTGNSGWGAEAKQTSNDRWSAKDNTWGTQETKPASTPQRQSSDGGWGSNAQVTTDGGSGASQKQTIDDGGWNVGADDGWKTQGSNGWGSKEKKASNNNKNRQSTSYNTSNNNNYSSRDRQQQQEQKPVDKWSSAGNSGWGNTTGWNTRDDQSDDQQPRSIPDSGWDSDNTSQHWQQQQQRGSVRTSGTATPTEQQQQPNEVVNFTLKDILKQSTAAPPPPPGLASPAAAAPAAAAPVATTPAVPQQTMASNTATFTSATASSAPGLTNTAASATAAALATSSLIMQHQQDIVPAEQMRVMSHDSLVNFVQNLQRDNTRLLQTLIGAQQEMSMQTSRYTELMSLSRERETQLLELFEARKQTEMEEARRYILSLEARISTLEGQLQTATAAAAAAAAASSSSNNNSHHNRERGGSLGGATAGFGNQDLFAGYREEMRTSQRGRRYNKNAVVRCGNCGGSGHTSAECQDVCRYCGSQDHLSETCSMNQ
ncbi:hypothetical protein BDB00DRAFT_927778 [Zychaea mexicana]|uniref:uncharacterized protein n=1 Tax=Zychaea mexicana TaxID=64656 RepID=UPI0022FE0A3F|nr:uncharacterized protein BDB00DRAFT_927778 [Zychaea mexicana]KAI9495091.1 hypothetical protein BDB00DRAFT_927778 [Zychaea mexicana]